MPTTHRRHGPAQSRAHHPKPDRRDPAATAVYNSPEWHKLRTLARALNPLCADPYRIHDRAGITEPATEVHHIQAIVDAPDRAYDLTNLMPLCNRCHARIDGDRRRSSRAHQPRMQATVQAVNESTDVQQIETRHD